MHGFPRFLFDKSLAASILGKKSGLMLLVVVIICTCVNKKAAELVFLFLQLLSFLVALIFFRTSSEEQFLDFPRCA